MHQTYSAVCPQYIIFASVLMTTIVSYLIIIAQCKCEGDIQHQQENQKLKRQTKNNHTPELCRVCCKSLGEKETEERKMVEWTMTLWQQKLGRQDFLDQMKHAQLYSDNLQATSEFHSFFSLSKLKLSKALRMKIRKEMNMILHYSAILKCTK